jgi:hypothetical protein
LSNQRKPLKLLKLEGGYRKHRHEDRTELPESESKAPDMPSFIKGAAAKEWKRIIKVLKDRGTLSLTNMATITQYCLMWAELEDNYKGGCEPMGAAFHTSFRLVCAEMAITPTSQNKISIPEKPKSNTGFDGVL